MAWIGRLVRAAAFTACFLAVLEVCARCDDALSYGAGFWGEYSENRLIIIDELGPRCRPNGRFEKWILDSNGFRGKETAVSKTPGTIRLMVVGASESFGLFESPGREFPAELGRRLAGSYRKHFEVINAGCAGMSPPRIVQLLDAHLARFQPDVVLFYPSPQFYLDDEPPQAWRAGAQPPREAILSSRLIRRVKTRMKSWMPASLQSRLRDLSVQRRVHQHAPGWVWAKPPWDRVELFRQHVRALVEATRRIGALPVLLTHANRFGPVITETDRQQLVILRRFFPRASLDVFVPFERAMNEALRQQAEALDVPLVDLERKVGKDPALFADSSHLTDKGAEALARVLSTEVPGLARSPQPSNPRDHSP